MHHKLALSSAALCLVIGCHTKQPQPTCTVALLDISASIYPEEVDREFEEMRKHASNMHRGDELILIPIMSNARNDTPGHIVQFVAPQSRASFDSDLVAFRRSVDGQITEMRDWAKQQPALHTDILGSLEIAAQKFQQMGEGKAELIVLSDFLQDDDHLNFTRDRAFTSVAAARALADELAKRQSRPICAVDTRLERIRSRDGSALPPLRLEAIDAFWSEFLNEGKIRTGSRIGNMYGKRASSVVNNAPAAM